MGLTSPLSVACPALALPVRGAVSGQWIRPIGQAFYHLGWPGFDGGSGKGLED